MSSSKKKSHSVKKDLSTSSQQEGDEEEPHSVTTRISQSIPDGLRLRNRKIDRAADTTPKSTAKVKKMKKGLVPLRQGSSSKKLESSLIVDEYFNDDEEQNLVIIESDEEDRKRKKKSKEVEHVTKFAKSEKSELIEFIYGCTNGINENSSSKFSYHNESLQNEESDEDLDETSSLNPIIPAQKLPQVNTKLPPKVSLVFSLLIDTMLQLEGKEDPRRI